MDFSIFVAWFQCCVTVVFITVSRMGKKLTRPGGHEEWGHTVRPTSIHYCLTCWPSNRGGHETEVSILLMALCDLV